MFMRLSCLTSVLDFPGCCGQPASGTANFHHEAPGLGQHELLVTLAHKRNPNATQDNSLFLSTVFPPLLSAFLIRISVRYFKKIRLDMAWITLTGWNFAVSAVGSSSSGT